MTPLYEALTGKVDRTKDLDFELNQSMTVGKVVDVHVVRGSYNGKPNNTVDGYKKYSGPSAPAA
jgi:hypothetical protein